MIKIKELRLKNFKSFKKAIIPFRDGVTTIVGANGSGKTNILDSLLFSLGTTSLKLLRANRLTDLVNISTNESYAKVDLVLKDNSKEWIITRLIDTKGKSVYRLNEERKSLNEINSLLTELGIQNDGHNIVAQGDVTALIEKNPIQRREIIDDISGIKEFDEKKQEAEKELGKVEEKIRETRIVLGERNSYLTKLEQERAAALQFETHTTQKRTLTASILNIEMDKIKELEEGLRKKIIDFNQKILEKDQKEKEIEASEEKIRSDIEDINNQLLHESSVLYMNTISKIEEKKTKRILLEQGIQNAQQVMRKHAEKIKEIQGNETELMNEVQKSENEHAQWKQKQTSLLKEHGNLREEIQAILEEINTAVSLEKDEKATIQQLAKVVQELEQNHKECPICERELSPTQIGQLKQKRQKEIKDHQTRMTELTNAVNQLDLKKQELEKIIQTEQEIQTKIQVLESKTQELRKILEKTNYGKEILLLEKETKHLEEANTFKLSELEALEKEQQQLDQILEKNKKENESKQIKKNTLAEKLYTLKQSKDELRKKIAEMRKEENQLEIEKSRHEVRWADMSEEFKEFTDVKTIKGDIKELRKELSEVEKKIQQLGNINLKAIESFDELKKEVTEITEKVTKLEEERKAVVDLMQKIEDKRKEVFMQCFESIRKNFNDMFYNFFKGKGDLELTDMEDLLEAGLIIKAQHKGDQFQRLESMSGGEKTLTALAFLFAIQLYEPAPFYVFDEADAALDKENSGKLIQVIKEMAKHSQFLIITHNDGLIKNADQIVGVALDQNKSSVIGLNLKESVMQKLIK
ncbi:MAG: AAA family ATPase [Candidatus Diapherotrites archaeon]|nr:AAA family ATPase [Candidatus Diapherotrites archaeon]